MRSVENLTLLDRYFEFLREALERSGKAIDSAHSKPTGVSCTPWHGLTSSAFFKAGAQAIGRLIATVKRLASEVLNSL